ncbi:uncharacterized protein LOC126746739 [Anthonomus grandis grandis]|uniref:uncharacterized protein LOC126746739 n=1 Tax=Anthonomus grandis grandis TaxID=2921223 RepID=UPI00216518C9|nr:uncharacterized protein LOC126746739 [Anthonomus grandis grandis]
MLVKHLVPKGHTAQARSIPECFEPAKMTDFQLLMRTVNENFPHLKKEIIEALNKKPRGDDTHHEDIDEETYDKMIGENFTPECQATKRLMSIIYNHYPHIALTVVQSLKNKARDQLHLECAPTAVDLSIPETKSQDNQVSTNYQRSSVSQAGVVSERNSKEVHLKSEKVDCTVEENKLDENAPSSSESDSPNVPTNWDDKEPAKKSTFDDNNTKTPTGFKKNLKKDTTSAPQQAPTDSTQLEMFKETRRTVEPDLKKVKTEPIENDPTTQSKQGQQRVIHCENYNKIHISESNGSTFVNGYNPGGEANVLKNRIEISKKDYSDSASDRSLQARNNMPQVPVENVLKTRKRKSRNQPSSTVEQPNDFERLLKYFKYFMDQQLPSGGDSNDDSSRGSTTDDKTEHDRATNSSSDEESHSKEEALEEEGLETKLNSSLKRKNTTREKQMVSSEADSTSSSSNDQDSGQAEEECSLQENDFSTLSEPKPINHNKEEACFNRDSNNDLQVQQPLNQLHQGTQSLETSISINRLKEIQQELQSYLRIQQPVMRENQQTSGISENNQPTVLQSTQQQNHDPPQVTHKAHQVAIIQQIPTSQSNQSVGTHDGPMSMQFSFPTEQQQQDFIRKCMEITQQLNEGMVPNATNSEGNNALSHGLVSRQPAETIHHRQDIQNHQSLTRSSASSVAPTEHYQHMELIRCIDQKKLQPLPSKPTGSTNQVEVPRIMQHQNRPEPAGFPQQYMNNENSVSHQSYLPPSGGNCGSCSVCCQQPNITGRQTVIHFNKNQPAMNKSNQNMFLSRPPTSSTLFPTFAPAGQQQMEIPRKPSREIGNPSSHLPPCVICNSSSLGRQQYPEIHLNTPAYPSFPPDHRFMQNPDLFRNHMNTAQFNHHQNIPNTFIQDSYQMSAPMQHLARQPQVNCGPIRPRGPVHRKPPPSYPNIFINQMRAPYGGHQAMNSQRNAQSIGMPLNGFSEDRNVTARRQTYSGIIPRNLEGQSFNCYMGNMGFPGQIQSGNVGNQRSKAPKRIRGDRGNSLNVPPKGIETGVRGLEEVVQPPVNMENIQVAQAAGNLMVKNFQTNGEMENQRGETSVSEVFVSTAPKDSIISTNVESVLPEPTGQIQATSTNENGNLIVEENSIKSCAVRPKKQSVSPQKLAPKRVYNIPFESEKAVDVISDILKKKEPEIFTKADPSTDTEATQQDILGTPLSPKHDKHELTFLPKYHKTIIKNPRSGTPAYEHPFNFPNDVTKVTVPLEDGAKKANEVVPEFKEMKKVVLWEEPRLDIPDCSKKSLEIVDLTEGKPWLEEEPKGKEPLSRGECRRSGPQETETYALNSTSTKDKNPKLTQNINEILKETIMHEQEGTPNRKQNMQEALDQSAAVGVKLTRVKGSGYTSQMLRSIRHKKNK